MRDDVFVTFSGDLRCFAASWLRNLSGIVQEDPGQVGHCTNGNIVDEVAMSDQLRPPRSDRIYL